MHNKVHEMLRLLFFIICITHKYVLVFSVYIYSRIYIKQPHTYTSDYYIYNNGGRHSNCIHDKTA